MLLRGGSWHSLTLYSVVKNLTYLLLFVNVLFFFNEELASLEHTFESNLTSWQFIQVFSATIDTAAWFFLLILLEK